MKRIWILLLAMALLAGLLAFAACGDDDDDDDDDDASDDDDGDDDDDNGDDDDDDDATAAVEVENVTVGTCMETEPDPTLVPTDAVEARWQSGTLHIWRWAALTSCDPDISITADLTDGVLTISESDAGGTDCDCTTNVEYDVTGIPGGNIDLVIGFSNTAKGDSDIATFTIETDGDDYEWRLPDLQFLSQSEPDYYANQPIALRVNACHLEDAGQIGDDPLKFQSYRYISGDLVLVNSLDRRNLTNPGNIDEDKCVLIDYEMAGLPAGTYDLTGVGYNYDDKELTVASAELVVQ
jgi:hypothetical protein